MIYAIPLADIESKFLNVSGITVDLDTAIFSVQVEMRSWEPNTRHKEAKVWIFDAGNDIMD